MATRIWSWGAKFWPKSSWWGLLFSRNLSSNPKPLPTTSIDTKELEKFTSLASQWWGEPYSPLRAMNTLRVPLIRDGLLSISGVKGIKPFPLEGYKIIDVGCGGGLLAEPLARLGASVTGLDPGQENIDAAIEHASKDSELNSRLNYVCDTVENFSQINVAEFDAVVCSEVIEHVADVKMFVNACVELTKDGGSVFFTTINRTFLSYWLAIVGAEYVLNIIPRGTHDWNKFVPPKELCDVLQSLNCRIVSIDGMLYNPFTKKWSWNSLKVNNYALHAVK